MMMVCQQQGAVPLGDILFLLKQHHSFIINSFIGNNSVDYS
jgi:hypothetical protein